MAKDALSGGGEQSRFLTSTEGMAKTEISRTFVSKEKLIGFPPSLICANVY